MKQRNSEENLDNYTTLDSCETSIVIKSESNDSKDHRPFNKLSLPINSLGREINIGPNVNINLPKKSFSTLEEKLYKKNKIQMKKKTELCKNWELYKDCYFKDSCSFAHGEEELVTNDVHMQKYKTKPCTMFFQKSYCKYGNRCIYSHLLANKKHLLSYSYLISQLKRDLANDLLTNKNKTEANLNTLTQMFKSSMYQEELNSDKISTLLYIYKHRKKLER